MSKCSNSSSMFFSLLFSLTLPFAFLKPKTTTCAKTDPNATTNKIASLRTEIAEKERRVAHLTNDNEKLNKQKMQSTTLLNGLQRENSAKDALVHQAKSEIEKLKRELREKDSTIATISTKVAEALCTPIKIALYSSSVETSTLTGRRLEVIRSNPCVGLVDAFFLTHIINGFFSI